MNQIKKHLLLAYKALYPELTFDALIMKVNREFLKSSMREIGDVLGVSKQSVEKWEKGQVGMSDKLKLRIAEALKFDVNEFKPEYWD